MLVEDATTRHKRVHVNVGVVGGPFFFKLLPSKAKQLPVVANGTEMVPARLGDGC